MNNLNPARWLLVRHTMARVNRGERGQEFAEQHIDAWYHAIDTALTKPRIDDACDQVTVWFATEVPLTGSPRLLLRLFADRA